MIYSMTGYGHGEKLLGNRRFLVEIKSVNHRYLDINIRVPRYLSALENNVRNELKSGLKRGKVEVYISTEYEAGRNVRIECNMEAAGQYVEHLRRMSDAFGLDRDLAFDLSHIASLPEVFSVKDGNEDEEELWEALRGAVQEAVASIKKARGEEGERLKEDLLLKQGELQGYVDVIDKKSPVIIEQYRTGLLTRIKEAMGDAQIDEGRVLTEAAIFADRVCIDEEIVRLKSHIKSLGSILETGGEVGRKLDFLAQEMNRESNTILSKVDDIEIKDIGIELKTTIEKIREQIQNLE